MCRSAKLEPYHQMQFRVILIASLLEDTLLLFREWIWHIPSTINRDIYIYIYIYIFVFVYIFIQNVMGRLSNYWFHTSALSLRFCLLCSKLKKLLPNTQEKIILTNLVARLVSANKQMPMSGPAYMHASIATPRLTANQHTGNGRDHLRMVERPDAHIIFPSWCSSEYSLSHITQHVNYTQV